MVSTRRTYWKPTLAVRQMKHANIYIILVLMCLNIFNNFFSGILFKVWECTYLIVWNSCEIHWAFKKNVSIKLSKEYIHRCPLQSLGNKFNISNSYTISCYFTIIILYYWYPRKCVVNLPLDHSSDGTIL